MIDNAVFGFRGWKSINDVAELVPEPEQIVGADVLFNESDKMYNPGICKVIPAEPGMKLKLLHIKLQGGILWN